MDDENLRFIGGTCLTKVFELVDRMSEDIDLAYSVLAETRYLREDGQTQPANLEEARIWRDETARGILKLLEKIYKEFDTYAKEQGVNANIFPYKEKQSQTFGFRVNYNPIFQMRGALYPNLKIEINGSWTGIPNTLGYASCYIGDNKASIETPTAEVSALTPEVIFWSKVIATIKYCHGFKRSHPRPKDWYDIWCILNSHVAQACLDSYEVGLDLAISQDLFYPDDRGSIFELLHNELYLVPTGSEPKIAYENLISKGMIFGPQTEYVEIIDRLGQLEDYINSVIAGDI